MSRRTEENVVAVIVLAVFAAVIVMSLGYGPRARLVPIPVAVIGIILTVIQLAWQNLRAAEDLHIDLLEVLTKGGGKPEAREPDKDAAKARERVAAQEKRRELRAFMLVLGLTGAVVLLGPMPSILLLTIGYFTLSRHYSPARSAVYGALFTLAVYLLFVVALQIQLYHGVLQPLVDWLDAM
jgi:hypothetical protein